MTEDHSDASHGLDQFTYDLTLAWLDLRRALERLEALSLPLDFATTVRTVRAISAAIADLMCEASDTATILTEEIPLAIGSGLDRATRWPLSPRDLVAALAIKNPGTHHETFRELLAQHGQSPDDYPDWPSPSQEGLTDAGAMMIAAREEFDRERAKRRLGSSLEVDLLQWLQALSDAYCATCGATPAIPCTTSKHEALPLHRSHRHRRSTAALCVGWTANRMSTREVGSTAPQTFDGVQES